MDMHDSRNAESDGSSTLVDAAFYTHIREIMESARKRAYSAANFAMVQAYWRIGESIVAKQKGMERAEYGTKLIQQLSKRMTADFGKGFTVANLKNMRQFYAGQPEGEIAPKRSEDLIRDPYVLEFLGLRQDETWLESDLEQALIDHLQDFMLELGRGFAFVGRQKRITIDGDHFYIDLVFYNYVTRCFVLIGLKTGTLTHQDLGQMQMYVHYYTRELMNEGDNPPVGLVMCANKKDAVVKYTLPEDERQIFVSECLPCLPSEDELRDEIRRQYDALEGGIGS